MKRVVGLLTLAWLAFPQSTTRRFDIILRHGTILDGTGLKPYPGDVGVIGGYIAKIGDLTKEHAQLELDVRGLYVAPGFINIHSHAAPNALPTAVNMLTQGVTTEIFNPDGGGSVDLAQQLSQSASKGLAVNIGAYIGFNSVWAKVVGPADRRPTPEDIAQMRALIESNLKQGAWGVSAGLDYKPGYYAHADEVERVVSVAGPWRTNFTNHDRITPESNFSSIVGMKETIAIGRETGLIPVITHMKVQGREQGRADEILGAMKKPYVAADAYPYLAGQTSLGALIIPAWAQDGGREEMLKRFQDPELRKRIVKEAEEAMDARFGGATGVYLSQTQRELTDIMRETNASAGEAVVQILEKQNAGVILRFGSEADLIKILQYPSTSIACDCGTSLDTHNHPRFWGSFPRVLGHYVRETKALTWEDAVRKMSGLPASTIGMVDRGFIMPGMRADIAIFDPKTVIDHATYEQPTLPSDGIVHVLVNGKIALRDGKATGEMAGQTLLRTEHMPSREMNVDSMRRFSLKNGQATLTISQQAGANRAKGSFRYSENGNAFEATEFGVLQTAPDWVSFTGRGRMRPSGDEHSFTAILDKNNLIVEIQ